MIPPRAEVVVVDDELGVTRKRGFPRRRTPKSRFARHTRERVFVVRDASVTRDHSHRAEYREAGEIAGGGELMSEATRRSPQAY